MSATKKVLKEIRREREAQDKKWGEQNHDPFAYLAILTEEVGELAQAALKTRFESERGKVIQQIAADRFGSEKMREEAIQVAAVAVAFIESLDRKKWGWGSHAE